MAHRVKWLLLGLPASGLSDLAIRMQKDRYSNERGWGFQLSKVRRSEVEGVFHRRVEKSDVVVDPFGREQKVTWVEYSQTDFRLSATFPQAQLTNAARATKELFDKISEYTDYRASIEQIDVDVTAWLSAVERSLGALVVTELRATDVSVSASAFGRVELSGSKDVRGDLLKVLNGRSARVDRLAFQWPHPDGPTRCELRADATALFDEKLARIAVKTLRESLESVIDGGVRGERTSARVSHSFE